MKWLDLVVAVKRLDLVVAVKWLDLVVSLKNPVRQAKSMRYSKQTKLLRE